MTLDRFLITQLQDFVLVYKNLFRKTFSVTIILSFVCLLFMAALHSYFGPATTSGNMSLTSYLWYSHSTPASYNLTDMAKPIVLFVISFFSIALSKKLFRDKENLNVQFGSFFDEMKPKDFGFLFVALAICLVADYMLQQLTSVVINNDSLNKWFLYLVNFLRVYMSLCVFAYFNKLILTNSNPGLSAKDWLFLLIALWLFNETANEFVFFVRVHMLQLLVAPFPPAAKFFAESILSLPLVALLFLGYHSAITNSLIILRKDVDPEYVPAA